MRALALVVTRTALGKPAAAREAFTQFLALAPRRYDQKIADAKQRLHHARALRPEAPCADASLSSYH